MYWNSDLIKHLVEAPWPLTKKELLEYAHRELLPYQVIENLEMLEDDQEYHGIEDIWPDWDSQDEYYNNDDEQ